MSDPTILDKLGRRGVRRALRDIAPGALIILNVVLVGAFVAVVFRIVQVWT